MIEKTRHAYRQFDVLMLARLKKTKLVSREHLFVAHLVELVELVDCLRLGSHVVHDSIEKRKILFAQSQQVPQVVDCRVAKLLNTQVLLLIQSRSCSIHIQLISRLRNLVNKDKNICIRELQCLDFLKL